MQLCVLLSELRDHHFAFLRVIAGENTEMTVLLTIYTAFGGKPAGRVNSVVITVDQKNFAQGGIHEHTDLPRFRP